jgi:acetyl esterase/lipase
VTGEEMFFYFKKNKKDDRKEDKKNISMKKKILKHLLIFLIVFVSFDVFSRLAFHRSSIASIAAFGIRIFNNGELATEENTERALEERADEEDEPFSFDADKYKSEADMIYIDGNEVLLFGNKEDSNDTVLYIHGGAYFNEITDYHLDFIDRMASETKAYVVVPLYPLAPNHTYEETYEFLDKIYPGLRNEDRELTVMGDSAGGGLSLAYAEYLLKTGGEQPDEIIVFSPWVDVSMSAEDHTPYEALDPMLEVPGTIEAGKAWAGDTDTKNYMVSPLFGDVEGLAKTIIFVGTNEILYPDCVAMYEKMTDAGVDTELVVGEGMNHIYPIYPIVPESLKAADMVFEEIKSEQ